MPRVREWEESMDPTCPFCWPGTIPKSEEEGVLVERKRIEANDPIALRQIGVRRYRKEDYSGAFEYWTKAAGLGDAGLHFELASMYHKWNGVEKDEDVTEFRVWCDPTQECCTTRTCPAWNDNRDDRLYTFICEQFSPDSSDPTEGPGPGGGH